MRCMICRQVNEIAAKSLLRACGCTVVLAFALLSGCDGEKPSSAAQAVPTDPPSVYMKDPAFREKLAEERAARNKILSTREKIVEELVGLEAAAKQAHPDATPEEIRAELEKNPEYKSLVQRVRDAEQAVADSRAKTLSTVRERLARPAENLSK